MLSRVAKPSTLTKYLTPDSKVPSIQQAENAPAELLRKARKVTGSFTWVAPEHRADYELKWISAASAQDLGLELDINDSEVAAILAGQKVVKNEEQGMYPYAQNYAGDQFGSWAGQLGDGRAITLFRVGDYDLQLKGAGMTPYSRFADGKAVLRSSIREALVSEYLHQLGIPTQRCLSLVYLPTTLARRERVEKCAVITRMAPSWIRIGTFQLHEAAQNRRELRKLADYCIDKLGLGLSDHDGLGNRYFAMFRDTALRNAKMMASCQAYGFLNGVLNTDNVSVLGFSLDYGPFAFMDTFSSLYTPNHDDWTNRYGFKNSPVIMWWNCIKLAECLAELIAMGENVDNAEYIVNGIPSHELEASGKIATDLIMGVGREFQSVYESEYQTLMLSRLGLTSNGNASEDEKLVEKLLLTMQECELDYNRFFRKLAHTQDVQDFMPFERTNTTTVSDEEVHSRISDFLSAYKDRLLKDITPNRMQHMDKVNPNFLLRNSVLANVIDLAETGNWDAFYAAANMCLHPFAESWSVPDIYSRRYMDDKLNLMDRDTQLSCSS